MRAVVTGAAGFVGSNLVRDLHARGDDVVAADVRAPDVLSDLGVEHAEIDVLDPDSLRAAFKGADVVFHLASIISIVGDPTGEVWRVNVEGAGNVAAAALACGATRLVHCSSVHAFDLARSGPSLDESGPRTVGEHAPVYDRSKYAGEQAVSAVIAEGMDAVFVNPTGVIGPYDHGPSRMGATLARFRDRTIPVNVGGGFDFVDVRDLVRGIQAAAARGRTGANYLLSGTRVSAKQLGQMASGYAGVPAPRFDVPLRLLEAIAPLAERFAHDGQEPLFTSDALHALRHSPHVSHFRAATELGYTSRPIHETVRDTIAWLNDNPSS